MKRKYFYQFPVIFFITAGIYLLSCKKADNGTLSTVITYTPIFISSTAATVGCIVNSDGGSGVVECGIYVSNAPNPETSSTKLKIGADTGTFLGQVTGFLPGVQYYIKAYAVNTKGESLGAQVDFTTPLKLTDYDNNSYETVKIGSQLWMAENLKTTRYKNGEVIGTTTPATISISGESTPEYQWAYNGDESNVTVYGRLYTGYVISDSRGICPDGWHVPTAVEFTNLISFLGGEDIAGGQVKEAGITYWNTPNTGATNVTLFSALPGGDRYTEGTFETLGTNCLFWSSTEYSQDRFTNMILQNTTRTFTSSFNNKQNGLAVRCLKD
jgi:uncharacterized protein (TIGR02145 family)